MAVSATPNQQEKSARLVRALSLTDAVLLVIGGVIGSGIFITSNAVATALPSPVLGIWISVVTGWAWLAVLSWHLYRVSPNTHCEGE